mmetsp:Transcript_94298/g.202428  ORF Transcript_94298/g.202428 Transcript_94298/m.202428 type:complete len:119 (+) Transcript_94298:58-414(+)
MDERRTWTVQNQAKAVAIKDVAWPVELAIHDAASGIDTMDPEQSSKLDTHCDNASFGFVFAVALGHGILTGSKAHPVPVSRNFLPLPLIPTCPPACSARRLHKATRCPDQHVGNVISP